MKQIKKIVLTGGPCAGKTTALIRIQEHFSHFLAEHGSELKSECYIPTVVDELIHNGKADCSVIKTTANWLGVTYPSDKPAVVESIAKLVEEGIYPAKLG